MVWDNIITNPSALALGRHNVSCLFREIVIESILQQLIAPPHRSVKFSSFFFDQISLLYFYISAPNKRLLVTTLTCTLPIEQQKTDYSV